MTIELADWGRIVQQSIHQIYALDNQFRQLEWQAVPCILAHIKPVGPKKYWIRRHVELAKLLMDKRTGWMRIRESPSESTAVIDFGGKINAEDEIEDLRELLVRVGCAQHVHRQTPETTRGV